MGSKSVVLALALTGCLVLVASSQEPKNYANETASTIEEVSGSQINNEASKGEHTDTNAGQLSFRNQNIFVIREDTGMSPEVPEKGVRYAPVTIAALASAPVAGSWYLTLTDTATRYLKLNLNQNLDAIFGNGELIEGSTTVPVTAGGTVLGDRLAIFVTPVGGRCLYRFSLSLTSGSLNGNYILSGPGVTQPGVAFGSMVSPAAAITEVPRTASNQSAVEQQIEPDQPETWTKTIVAASGPDRLPQ